MVFTHRKIRGLISFNHILSPCIRNLRMHEDNHLSLPPTLDYFTVGYISTSYRKFSSFYENCIIQRIGRQNNSTSISFSTKIFYSILHVGFFFSQSTFLTSATLKEKGFITSYSHYSQKQPKIEQKSNIIYKRRRIFIFYTAKCIDVEYIKNIIKEMVNSFFS